MLFREPGQMPIHLANTFWHAARMRSAVPSPPVAEHVHIIQIRRKTWAHTHGHAYQGVWENWGGWGARGGGGAVALAFHSLIHAHWRTGKRERRLESCMLSHHQHQRLPVKGIEVVSVCAASVCVCVRTRRASTSLACVLVLPLGCDVAAVLLLLILLLRLLLLLLLLPPVTAGWARSIWVVTHSLAARLLVQLRVHAVCPYIHICILPIYIISIHIYPSLDNFLAVPTSVK